MEEVVAGYLVAIGRVAGSRWVGSWGVVLAIVVVFVVFFAAVAFGVMVVVVGCGAVDFGDRGRRVGAMLFGAGGLQACRRRHMGGGPPSRRLGGPLAVALAIRRHELIGCGHRDMLWVMWNGTILSRLAVPCRVVAGGPADVPKRRDETRRDGGQGEAGVDLSLSLFSSLSRSVQAGRELIARLSVALSAWLPLRWRGVWDRTTASRWAQFQASLCYQTFAGVRACADADAPAGGRAATGAGEREESGGGGRGGYQGRW